MGWTFERQVKCVAMSLLICCNPDRVAPLLELGCRFKTQAAELGNDRANTLYELVTSFKEGVLSVQSWHCQMVEGDFCSCLFVWVMVLLNCTDAP